MSLNDEKIKTISDYFRSCPVLKAYLFGSYVRGEADQQSDIDILVDLDYSQKIGLQFIQMKIDLERLLHTKVCLLYTSDAADEEDSVDLGGRRIIKKKK